MTPQDNFFQEEVVDAQLDALARTQEPVPPTASSRAYQSLRRLHAAQAEQEAQSIERVRRRLVAHTTRPSYPREVWHEPAYILAPLPMPESRPGHSMLFRVLIGTIAAVLVMSLLVGSYVALLRPLQPVQSLVRTPFAQHPWRIVSSPNTLLPTNALNGIAATSSDDAWAVGTAQDKTKPKQSPIIEHWNGGHWQLVSTPALAGGGSLAAVVSLAPDNAWAVGEVITSSPITGPISMQALIEHWDGHEWAVVPGAALPTGLSGLTSLVALSVNDIWAVGWFETPVVQTVGNTEQGLIEHWNGQRWQVVANPSLPLVQRYSSVAASAPDDVWAVGYGKPSGNSLFQTVTEHWDGHVWKLVASPNESGLGNGLYAVTAISANDVWAMGLAETEETSDSTPVTTYTQKTLFEHWNGQRWSMVASPQLSSAINTPAGIVALGPDDVWAVGWTVMLQGSGQGMIPAQGLIEHWDGQRWSLVTNPQPQPFISLFGIARDPSTPGKLWIVGSYGAQGDPGDGTSASTLIETNG